jgi:hypothetical protein
VPDAVDGAVCVAVGTAAGESFKYFNYCAVAERL